MGRDKQVIFSIGVGLILLSTVIGCAAKTKATVTQHRQFPLTDAK